MSEMKWTKEQYAAITLKECNLLVAAAAGSGKTAVLVERIIQKIIDEQNPIDIDSLLVVTFTNAAATEMRERIGAAISKAIEENQGSKNIHKQLALLNKAAITTIHSFCLEVIRNNFQSIDIDPKFRILDETEATLLKIETLNELFEEIYENEENNKDFFELLESYGTNRDDQSIQDMVLNIYGFVQSYPWPEQWLQNQVENFNIAEQIDFLETPWGKILLQTTKIRLEGLVGVYEAACRKLQYALGLEKYLPVFLNDLDNLQRLIRICKSQKVKWNEVYQFLQNIEFETLPRCGKDAPQDIQESVKKTRDELKAIVKNLKEEVYFIQAEDITADLKAMYPVLSCLTRLVLDFSERYSAKKNKRSSVDFGDLEHFCLKILSEIDEEGKICPTKVARAYKDKFREILVDEYQDSNLVQEIIISMISREDMGKPNVFMVGDVKQSIYRFRQAKPELFLDKYNQYSAEENSLYRKILLFKNFRSRKEVVDGVNFIFKQIMSQTVGELDYTEIEELNPGADFIENEDEDRLIGGPLELHLIETAIISQNETAGDSLADEANDEQEEQDSEEILDSIQQEARMVANRIIELMEPDKQGRKFSIYDKKKNRYRDLQFKDIVILLRTTKNWTEIFGEELAKSGIPTFADTGSGFFKTPEVQVILSLLQIIDNPHQDIPLLSVLRSQIANFSTNDLAELRLANKKSSLFEALKVLALGEGSASAKAVQFLNRLEHWRGIALYIPTHKLIWQLYNETGYFSIVGAMQDGERKQANLRILFERSLQFEGTSYKGLFNFINFIDKLKTSQGDMGSAKILGENDNVVRLMSIHKSKGLEFPVVFVSGCGKKFNFQDMYKSVLLHQELGFGPDFVDYKKRIKYPSIPKQAIAQKVKIETLSEEMRILYVALTRAKEKLILTGNVGNIQKSAVKWIEIAQSGSEKFPAHDMLKAQNYLNWICPAIMRHSDSKVLRDSGGLGVEYNGAQILDESQWRVYLYNQKDVTMQKVLEIDEDSQIDLKGWLEERDESLKDSYHEIDRRLNWKYKYENLRNIPSKISVTELKRYFNINNEGEDSFIIRKDSIKKPAFLQQKKGLSSAEKGTTMHFVMQHIDFNNSDIESQFEDMVKKDLITDTQAKSVDVKKIMSFITSTIGMRMKASGKIYREVPFNIELPYSEIYSGIAVNADEKILLQGVIDCYFEENNKIILIDYKTDFVLGDNLNEIREKYSIQISYYAKALELLTKYKVAEKYIYLFSTGQLLDFNE